MAGLAAFLLEEANAFHGHAAVDGLAHVVDGEQAHLHSGEGFHLDAGAADGFGGDGAADGVIALDGEVGGDAGQGDRVTQGDQVGGALGALDRGDPGDADHVALLVVAGKNAGEGGRLHHDPALGTGDPARLGFGRDIHHVGLALGVEMGEGVAHQAGNQNRGSVIITPEFCETRINTGILKGC